MNYGIPGFRRGVAETMPLWDFYVAYFGIWLLSFPDFLSVPACQPTPPNIPEKRRCQEVFPVHTTKSYRGEKRYISTHYKPRH